MKQHIPNLLTLLNLLLGCIAIVCAMSGNIEVVPYLVIGAGIADFLDGFVARLLKVSSPLGLQLDSLADMVTFGVLPGVTMFVLLQNAYGATATLYHTLPGFVLTIFSALRLAKFNIDTRQTDGFIGLPTPSNTMFITSLIWVAQSDSFLAAYLTNPVVLYVIIALFSYLLVAEIPMLSNKVKQLGIKGNEKMLLLILGAAVLIVFLGKVGVSLAVLWYVLLSVVLRRINFGK